MRLDRAGRILPWDTSPSAYAHTAARAWEALLTRFPTLPNGQKTYVTYSRFDPDDLEGVPWPHNPAGLYAMLTDSALLYYPYTGDSRVLAFVGSLLDYQIAHGTTPRDWVWGRVPFASGTAGETEYTGGDDDWCNGCRRGDGVGVLEPDKVGELGLAYLKYYEATGITKYLEEAKACADALAKTIEPGSAERSPWPFRVTARTGEAKDPYSANVLGPIELFDELIRLGMGATLTYEEARNTAWHWLVSYPLLNDSWAGYFEDIVPADTAEENPNQYIASRVAEFMLNHPDGPAQRADVRHLIEWIRRSFAADTDSELGTQWGAEVLSEQRADMAKMGSHTARYAALLALYFERTGDRSVVDRAFRSFNWATYMEREDGIVTVGENKDEGYWFSDGYGDYIRHFLKGVASYPAWAPPDETHLLRSTSVVRRIEYGEAEVRYTTFDDEAEDRFTLRRPPHTITVGGTPLEETGGTFHLYRLDGGGVVLDLFRSAPGEVVIAL